MQTAEMSLTGQCLNADPSILRRKMCTEVDWLTQERRVQANGSSLKWTRCKTTSSWRLTMTSIGNSDPLHSGQRCQNPIKEGTRSTKGPWLQQLLPAQRFTKATYKLAKSLFYGDCFWGRRKIKNNELEWCRGDECRAESYLIYNEDGNRE